jgi:methionyl-tRNA formyltransferase
MGESPTGWRVVVIAVVLPIAEQVIAAVRGMGHDVVAWVLPRRPHLKDQPPPPWGETTDRTAPQDVNVILARDKADLAQLLRGLEPDVVVTWGFPWKLPQDALDIPRYGSVNQHPAPLPRHRGPIPMSWALREGDTEFFVTWHRMDAELDTGPILAQGTVPLDDDDTQERLWEKLYPITGALLARSLERLEAGDRGDPQPTEGATWAPVFEDEFAEIDWTRTAREVHNQVRSWSLPTRSGIRGAHTTLDGQRVKVTRSQLVSGEHPPAAAGTIVAREGESVIVQCGDGFLRVLETEPATLR